jgi:hypothetical protein
MAPVTGTEERLEAELDRRRRAEEELRQSTERLRYLVEQTGQIAFRYLVGPRRFDYLSPGVADLLGHPVSAFLERPGLALDIVHDEDRPLLHEYVEAGDYSRPLAVRVRRADGADLWLQLRALPGLDIAGDLVSLDGLVTDVTAYRPVLEDPRRRGDTVGDRERLLDEIRRIGSATLASLDLDHVLDTLAEQVVRAGILRSLMVALVDHEERTVRVVRNFLSFEGRYEEGVGRVRPGGPITSSPTVARRDGERLVFTDERIVGAVYDLDDDNITPTVARTGQLTVIDGADNRFDDRIEKDNDGQQRARTVSYFVPVARQGRVLAVLATGSQVDDREETLRRIDAMAPLLEQAAVALDHARTHGRVRDDARELHDLNSRLREEISLRLETEARLRSFTERTVHLAEEERRRVARELHDGVNQLLCGVGFALEAAGQEAAGASFEHSRQLLDRSIEEVRRISQDLRPVLLDDLGLAAAIRTLCHQVQERTGQRIEHDVDALPAQLPSESAITTYRLVQQALLQWLRPEDERSLRLVVDAEEASLTARLLGPGAPGDVLPEAALASLREHARLLDGTIRLEADSPGTTALVIELPLGGSP